MRGADPRGRHVARRRAPLSGSLVLITVAYAAGATLPLFVLVAARPARRRGLRAGAPARPRAAPRLGRRPPARRLAVHHEPADAPGRRDAGYLSWIQSPSARLPSGPTCAPSTRRRAHSKAALAAGNTPDHLKDFGPAPDFAGISAWINTPGSQPLSLAKLRGKVVLVDFWTYSCVNCIRTLPYLKAWYSRYHDAGLVIVGVHTPEFAFEHVVGNVRRAVREHDIRYPVAVDDGYKTWNAWANQYWPADYLIDRKGHVRDAHFGEGAYGQTEDNIRTLLGERASAPHAAPKGAISVSGTVQSPETYLGTFRAHYSQDVHANTSFDLRGLAQVVRQRRPAPGRVAGRESEDRGRQGRAPAAAATSRRASTWSPPRRRRGGLDLGNGRRQGASAHSRPERRSLPARTPRGARARTGSTSPCGRGRACTRSRSARAARPNRSKRSSGSRLEQGAAATFGVRHGNVRGQARSGQARNVRGQARNVRGQARTLRA